MTARTITTPSSRSLYYRSTGEGPALLLIHGFPASGVLWNGVADELSKTFTLLIPDLPGTGHSRLDGEAISMEELASCMKAILDDAGFSAAVIAGHSMGGYIALAFAEKYPAAVVGLSLIHSTAAADDEEKKAFRQKTIALIRKGGKDAFVRGFVPTLFGRDFKKSHPDKITEQAEDSARMPDAAMIAFYTAMMERSDSREALSGAAFPVQWVVGEDDAIIPPEKAMQQTFLSNVSFVNTYAGTGHMSMLEWPARLAADLNDFTTYCMKKEPAAKQLSSVS